MPVAYAPARRQLERHDRAEERVGHLDRDARAVAGVGLGAGRAPVVQAAHRGERLVEDRVALAALHVDDEADAAAVVLEAGVVETLAPGRSGFACVVAAIAIGHVMSSSCSGGQSQLGCWDLATAGRHWPVGGADDCSGRVRKSLSGRRPSPSSSSASTRRPTAAASPGASPNSWSTPIVAPAQRPDAAQAVEPGAAQVDARAPRVREVGAREIAAGERHVVEPRRRRSRHARSTDPSKRTCVQLRRAGSSRRRAGSRRRSPCASFALPSSMPMPGSRRGAPAARPPRRSRSPARSQRTSSTSTSRARANATPAWRAPTTRPPTRSPSSSSSSSRRKSSAGLDRPRGYPAPRCRDPAAPEPLARPLDPRRCRRVVVLRLARNSLAGLVARDITKSFGPHVVLDAVSRHDRPAQPRSASSRPTAPASRRC